MAIQFVMLGVTLFIMVVLGYFTMKTKMGMGLRSVSQNLRAANLMGVPVNKVVALAFAVGSVLAAIAGVLSLSLIHIFLPNDEATETQGEGAPEGSEPVSSDD